MRAAGLIIRVVFFAVAGSVLAHAQQSSDAAKAMTGIWEISNADRDKICMVTFKQESAPGGRKLEFEKTCADSFPLTKEVSAWTIGVNVLRFVDAKGKTLLDLDEVEKGIFEGQRPEDGRYFMQNPESAHVVPTPDQVLGDWAVSRGTDTPLCIITFSNTAVAENFSLQLKPGCDPAVTAFNPTSWHMEKGELVLSAAGSAWRFEEAGQVAWRRVPEGTEPLWLVRQ